MHLKVIRQLIDMYKEKIRYFKSQKDLYYLEKMKTKDELDGCIKPYNSKRRTQWYKPKDKRLALKKNERSKKEKIKATLDDVESNIERCDSKIRIFMENKNKLQLLLVSSLKVHNCEEEIARHKKEILKSQQRKSKKNKIGKKWMENKKKLLENEKKLLLNKLKRLKKQCDEIDEQIQYLNENNEQKYVKTTEESKHKQTTQSEQKKLLEKKKKLERKASGVFRKVDSLDVSIKENSELLKKKNQENSTCESLRIERKRKILEKNLKKLERENNALLTNLKIYVHYKPPIYPNKTPKDFPKKCTALDEDLEILGKSVEEFLNIHKQYNECNRGGSEQVDERTRQIIVDALHCAIFLDSKYKMSKHKTPQSRISLAELIKDVKTKREKDVFSLYSLLFNSTLLEFEGFWAVNFDIFSNDAFTEILKIFKVVNPIVGIEMLDILTRTWELAKSGYIIECEKFSLDSFYRKKINKFYRNSNSFFNSIPNISRPKKPLKIIPIFCNQELNNIILALINAYEKGRGIHFPNMAIALVNSYISNVHRFMKFLKCADTLSNRVETLSSQNCYEIENVKSKDDLLEDYLFCMKNSSTCDFSEHISLRNSSFCPRSYYKRGNKRRSRPRYIGSYYDENMKPIQERIAVEVLCSPGVFTKEMFFSFCLNREGIEVLLKKPVLVDLISSEHLCEPLERFTVLRGGVEYKNIPALYLLIYYKEGLKLLAESELIEKITFEALNIEINSSYDKKTSVFIKLLGYSRREKNWTKSKEEILSSSENENKERPKWYYAEKILEKLMPQFESIDLGLFEKNLKKEENFYTWRFPKRVKYKNNIDKIKFLSARFFVSRNNIFHVFLKNKSLYKDKIEISDSEKELLFPNCKNEKDSYMLKYFEDGWFSINYFYWARFIVDGVQKNIAYADEKDRMIFLRKFESDLNSSEPEENNVVIRSFSGEMRFSKFYFGL